MSNRPSFIDEAVLHHDYRAGHFSDLSGNANDGTPTATVWQGGGVTFPASGSEIEVSDSAELQGTEFTLVAFGDLSNPPGNGRLLSKRDGGGTNFDWMIRGTTGLQVYDGTANLTIATAINDKRCFAINMKHGETPEGFTDGLSVGNYSAAATLSADNAPLIIGNYSSGGASIDSAIQAVLIFPRKLTATEHAELFAYLSNLQWPSKVWGHAHRRQIGNPAEVQIISAWDGGPDSSTLVDRITGYNGTIQTGIGSRKSILGEALTFVDGGGLITTTLSTGPMDPYSWSCWVIVTAATENINTLFGSSVINGIAIQVRNWNIRVIDAVSGGSDYETATQPINRYQLHHIGVSWATDGTVTVYVDGVLVGTGAITQASYAVSNTYLGGSYNGDYLGGTLICPEIYNVVKDADWFAAKYLEGANAVQFKTDWNFKESVANEGGVMHQEIGGVGSPIQTVTDKFNPMWRVETDTINSRIVKALVNKVAGLSYITTEHYWDASTTDAAFGEWEFWVYHVSTSTFKIPFIAASLVEGAGDYRLQIDPDGSVLLIESGVDTLFDTVAQSVTDDQWTHFRITRSSTGVFTVYQDHVLLSVAGGTGTNPVTDLTTTISNYFIVTMNLGDKICLGAVDGSYSITKKLGVT